jgi:hypothetical protein
MCFKLYISLLKFTYGQEVTFKDVLHALEIRKSLISSLILNKVGLRQILENDQYILEKNGNFIGKDYV